ncbi:MAG: ATP-binding protein [Propionibacteriaceae bacterium]|jgi:molecular chaperone HtpG|nr:ATP-binding protein [Propionibacteriaceae bacterium]
MEEVGSTFQVDLRGIVDLLARHLYSGPNVYLRELLQNGVDAITARRGLEPNCPDQIRIRPWGEGGLEVTDSGIGLTTDEARELLATVGRSSKRDLDLGVGREEFLGQFGIGLLSAFMVADTIELVSRSARDLNAPAVKWTGHDDGHYDLSELPREPGDPVGSIVRILPRIGMEQWLTIDMVVSLAVDFGSLLPVDVQVEVPLADALTGQSDSDVPPGQVPLPGMPDVPEVDEFPDLGKSGVAVDELLPNVGGGTQLSLPGDKDTIWRRVSIGTLPWLKTYPHDVARKEGLSRFCETTMGFTPMAVIDLSVPVAGLSGVAFVIPDAIPPSAGGYHRVYLKQMLLGSRVTGLVPDWAFFVRCTINATGLAPTASREQLYADDTLLATQEALAAQLKQWVVDTLSAESQLSKEFVHTHHLALRSLAASDEEVLDLAAEVLPYETTDGIRTLRDIQDSQGEVVYTESLEEYRRVGMVARGQGIVLVNAGYVYDGELLTKLADRPGWKIRPLSTDDIAQVLTPVEPTRELEILDQLAAATELLEDLDIAPVVRTFEPHGLPAMILDSANSGPSFAMDDIMDAADIWSEVLEDFDISEDRSRQIIFNDTNMTVQRWLALDPKTPFFKAGLESMYVSAVLLSGEPLHAREAKMMNDSLETFLSWGLPAGDINGTLDS